MAAFGGIGFCCCKPTYPCGGYKVPFGWTVVVPDDFTGSGVIHDCRVAALVGSHTLASRLYVPRWHADGCFYIPTAVTTFCQWDSVDPESTVEAKIQADSTPCDDTETRFGFHSPWKVAEIHQNSMVCWPGGIDPSSCESYPTFDAVNNGATFGGQVWAQLNTSTNRVEVRLTAFTRSSPPTGFDCTLGALSATTYLYQSAALTPGSNLATVSSLTCTRVLGSGIPNEITIIPDTSLAPP